VDGLFDRCETCIESYEDLSYCKTCMEKVKEVSFSKCGCKEAFLDKTQPKGVKWFEPEDDEEELEEGWRVESFCPKCAAKEKIVAFEKLEKDMQAAFERDGPHDFALLRDLLPLVKTEKCRSALV